MIHFLYAADLQLFSESGAASDGAGAAPAAEGTEGTTGENTAAAAGQEDVFSEFEALTAKDGKYAEAFQKKLQQSFNKRYAEFKETEGKAERLEKFKNAVASDYADVDANDIDALEKAYLTDARRFADKAFETGKTAQELAKDDYMSRKLKEYEEREATEKARRAKEAEARKFYGAVARQERDMMKKYAGFNLETELQNNAFRAMVKSGVPLEDAYFAVHRADLMQKAVNDAKNATIQTIAQRGTRETESAAGGTPPAVSKVDFSTLSRKEFMKIFNE